MNNLLVTNLQTKTTVPLQKNLGVPLTMAHAHRVF